MLSPMRSLIVFPIVKLLVPDSLKVQIAFASLAYCSRAMTEDRQKFPSCGRFWRNIHTCIVNAVYLMYICILVCNNNH